MSNAPRRASRSLPRMLLAAGACLALASSAGCEWWLFITQGSNELAEDLIENKDPAYEAGGSAGGAVAGGGQSGAAAAGSGRVSGGGGGGSGGGSGSAGGSGASGGGGGTGGNGVGPLSPRKDSAGDGELDAGPDFEAAKEIVQPVVTLHVAGHRWNVERLFAVPIDNGCIALEAHVESAGARGGLRIVLRGEQWARNARGGLVEFSYTYVDPQPHGAPPLKDDTLTLNGRDYALTLIGAAVRENDDGSLVIGVVDAHAVRTMESGAPVEQLVRIRIEPPAPTPTP